MERQITFIWKSRNRNCSVAYRVTMYPSNFEESIKIQQKQQPSFSLKFGASIKISLLSARPFILD